MVMDKHHRRPGQGHHSRVRRPPVPRPPKILDEIATEVAAAHGAPPHEMYFDTKAYADAISQLAKALAELEPQAVYELFEECEYLLMHDLAETLSREHPDFDARLEVLRQ
jgi:hypothetical protein